MALAKPTRSLAFKVKELLIELKRELSLKPLKPEIL
eukprot:CAMPEP_0197476606 /NCGR_PEP_ID=MMETSP1309-20131121/8659_1 /TAXON_ID=464262 /ORGANISM="Genus nov. species nov., Strain RCC998" /LENGTH=35 /DNA_ID= /DNA_START= /DNA_END= /DNA_ORIENTATION=